MYATEKAIGIFVTSTAIVYICKKTANRFLIDCLFYRQED